MKSLLVVFGGGGGGGGGGEEVPAVGELGGRRG